METTRASGYQGPRFSYSMEHVHNAVKEKSVEQYLGDVYKNAELPIKPLLKLSKNVDNSKRLQQWLGRLCWAAEGGSRQVGATRFKAFYQAIVRDLELAECDERYWQVFRAIVIEGCESCGDRIALSVIRLGMWRQRIELSAEDAKGIWKCLKQFLAMDVLEECAGKKALTMKYVDEIEVYLAYPIELREELGLSLDVTEMLFVSGVTKSDLKDAANKVKSAWNDPEKVVPYLLKQKEWMDMLATQYPDEMKQVEELKKAMDEVESDEELVELHEKIERQLKELTIQVLERVSR
jgi:hypothetical protein